MRRFLNTSECTLTCLWPPKALEAGLVATSRLRAARSVRFEYHHAWWPCEPLLNEFYCGERFNKAPRYTGTYSVAYIGQVTRICSRAGLIHGSRDGSVGGLYQI